MLQFTSMVNLTWKGSPVDRRWTLPVVLWWFTNVKDTGQIHILRLHRDRGVSIPKRCDQETFVNSSSFPNISLSEIISRRPGTWKDKTLRTLLLIPQRLDQTIVTTGHEWNTYQDGPQRDRVCLGLVTWKFSGKTEDVTGVCT